jgi:hypothetical protein
VPRGRSLGSHLDQGLTAIFATLFETQLIFIFQWNSNYTRLFPSQGMMVAALSSCAALNEKQQGQVYTFHVLASFFRPALSIHKKDARTNFG